MHRSGFIRTIGLVAAAVVVVGVLLYYTLQPAAGWPSEDRRVVHPAGFSIVRPTNWEQHLAFHRDGRGEDSLRLLPKQVVGGTEFLKAMKLPAPATEAELRSKKYDSTTFAGSPAWDRITEQTFTKEHTRSLVFERDGVWFDVTVRRPKTEPLRTGIWAAYADSFRIEPVRTVTPTTLPGLPAPATTPATTTAAP